MRIWLHKRTVLVTAAFSGCKTLNLETGLLWHTTWYGLNLDVELEDSNKLLAILYRL